MKTSTAAKLTHRVLDARGKELFIDSVKTVCLLRAQRFAEKHPDQGEWRVWAYPPHGDRVLVYKVVRDEDGCVLTHVIEDVD